MNKLIAMKTEESSSCIHLFSKATNYENKFYRNMLYNFIPRRIIKLFKKFKVEYPEVHKQPVVEDYHGTKVIINM